jgi:hypothetical protein
MAETRIKLNMLSAAISNFSITAYIDANEISRS